MSKLLKDVIGIEEDGTQEHYQSVFLVGVSDDIVREYCNIDLDAPYGMLFSASVADRLGQVLRDALGSNQMEWELPKMVKQAAQKVDALNATTKLATARIMLQVVVALLASASQGGKKTGQRVRPFRVDLQGLGTN